MTVNEYVQRQIVFRFELANYQEEKWLDSLCLLQLFYSVLHCKYALKLKIHVALKMKANASKTCAIFKKINFDHSPGSLDSAMEHRQINVYKKISLVHSR